ncbi:hypothetical protein PMAYCL1PPCAC_19751, partial [Pristionchus mayeri]
FRNAIISWVGSIPTFFLVLIAIVNPHLWKRYKDRPSSMFMCSITRTTINYVSLVQQAVEPVVVLIRYRRILLYEKTPVLVSLMVGGTFAGAMASLVLILVYGVSTVFLSVLTAIFLRTHLRKMAGG